MKSSFYLKHDLDARDKDPNMRAMIIKLGARGSGIYWWIVEDLYKNNGRIPRDYEALAWAYHEPVALIKSVAEDFRLFTDSHGKLSCSRVDRDLNSRRDAAEKASLAGKASAAQRALNGRSTTVQPGEERRGEEGKDRTTAPAAVDLKSLAKLKGATTKSEDQLLAQQMPFGECRGRRVIDLDPTYCAWVVNNVAKLSVDLRRGLELRVRLKAEESNGARK